MLKNEVQPQELLMFNAQKQLNNSNFMFQPDFIYIYKNVTLKKRMK